MLPACGPGRSIHWSQQCLTFPAGDEDSETPNKGSDHPYASYLYLLFHMVYTRVFKLSCAKNPPEDITEPHLKETLTVFRVGPECLHLQSAYKAWQCWCIRIPNGVMGMRVTPTLVWSC